MPRDDRPEINNLVEKLVYDLISLDYRRRVVLDDVQKSMNRYLESKEHELLLSSVCSFIS